MNAIQRGFFAAALAALASSCLADDDIIRRPQIEAVKKVAVVAVNANAGVNALGRQSTSGSVTTLIGMFGRKKPDDQVAEFGGNKLPTAAQELFTQELGKVKGWQAIPPAQFMSTPAYEKFKANIKVAEDPVFSKVAVQARGTPYVDARTPLSHPILAELARELDVDGVIIVRLDVAYSPSPSIGGVGMALPAVGYFAQMIDRAGEIALDTTIKGHHPYRLRKSADTPTPMVARNIVYTPEVEVLFIDSIRKDAVELRGLIDEQLSRKAEAAAEPSSPAATPVSAPAPSSM